MGSDLFLKKIEKKLELARKALKTPNCYFGPHVHDLVDELMELEIDHSEEIWAVLGILLQEISPIHYIPPEKALFSEISEKVGGCEVFVFNWDSEFLSSNATLQFALNGNHFYYLSLKKNGAST